MRKPNPKVKERIRDKDVLEAYNRYEVYLKELEIYEQYKQANGKVKVARLYEEAGINVGDKQAVVERFQTLTSEVEAAKEQNPDLDLKDIGTQKGRQVVSGIISETEKDKDFKASDLSDVAVIDNLSLYSAVRDVNEKLKFKDVALVHYDLTEQELLNAQKSYMDYKKSSIMEKFNSTFKDVGSIVHYAAAALQETPVNVYEAFKRLGLEKTGEYTPKKQKFLQVEDISQLVIDNIMRDPRLTLQEKNEKINELQLAEIDRKRSLAMEANAKQGGQKYKVVVEDKSER